MSTITEKTKKLPNQPGVYYFLGRHTKKRPNKNGRAVPCRSFMRRREVLYIGKAASLKGRVRSYFSDDVADMRGPAIKKMVADAEDISYEATESVLEAVILEARRIREYRPKYNVREKDDKSFNYVVITDEEYPRVLLVREKELLTTHYKLQTSFFGPFPHAGTLREALAVIRKIFPFRSDCAPRGAAVRGHAQIKRGTTQKDDRDRICKPCFNRQIGLCPGVCTGEVSKKEYAKTIRNITLLFEGKKKTLVSKLTREMNAAAQSSAFERAAELRNAIFALTHIQDISLIKHIPDTNYQTQNTRIEAYDIAHMGGAQTAGVMTVVAGGTARTSEYRQFKIIENTRGSDTSALKEILERRLAHSEWPMPRVLVVDGGTAQVNVARRILAKYGYEIPIVGVVKNEHHKAKRFDGDTRHADLYERDILLANSEAHRFALSFHRRRMRARYR